MKKKTKKFWGQVAISIVLGVIVISAGYLVLLFLWLLYEFLFGK